MNKILKQQIEKVFETTLLDKVLQIGDKQTVYIGYREFPRKPRPLAARMNWKNKFKIT